MHFLTKTQFAALLPQRDAMCLLDTADSWNATGIVCGSMSHTRVENPLRCRGQLPAVAGIEYAAQAMALHGALAVQRAEVSPQAGVSPLAMATPGMLASVRDVMLHVTRLDDIPDRLTVSATQLVAQQRHLLYSFSVEGGGRILLEGRIAVALGGEGGAV